jgi:hypothetical protein
MNNDGRTITNVFVTENCGNHLYFSELRNFIFNAFGNMILWKFYLFTRKLRGEGQVLFIRDEI